MPDTKASYSDFIYMTFWKRQNCRDRNEICSGQGGRGGGMGHEGTVQSDENVLYFGCSVTRIYVRQNSSDCNPKKVGVILCKLYLNKPEFENNQIKTTLWYHFLPVY